MLKKLFTKENVKELLLGFLYGFGTMLFLIGMLPWELVSKIIACVIAMLAILRIRKKAPANKVFAGGYIGFVAVCMILLNLISTSGK